MRLIAEQQYSVHTEALAKSTEFVLILISEGPTDIVMFGEAASISCSEST
jgi:hypothetical protein